MNSGQNNCIRQIELCYQALKSQGNDKKEGCLCDSNSHYKSYQLRNNVITGISRNQCGLVWIWYVRVLSMEGDLKRSINIMYDYDLETGLSILKTRE